MAKKAAEKINRSAAIRAYLAENPTAKNGEVAEAVNKQLGTKIDATYVSIVKNAKKGTGKRGRKPGSTVARMTTSAAASSNGAKGDIFDAIKMIRQAVAIIGPAKAKETVDMFA